MWLPYNLHTCKFSPAQWFNTYMLQIFTAVIRTELLIRICFTGPNSLGIHFDVCTTSLQFEISNSESQPLPVDFVTRFVLTNLTGWFKQNDVNGDIISMKLTTNTTAKTLIFCETHSYVFNSQVFVFFFVFMYFMAIIIAISYTAKPVRTAKWWNCCVTMTVLRLRVIAPK